MRPVAPQTVCAQGVITGVQTRMLNSAIDGADGQRHTRLVMTAIGLDISIQVTADLKCRHVVVVFGGLPAKRVVIAVLLTTAVNHSPPAHGRSVGLLVIAG
ncbi:hypothetical protein D3C71_1652270 [compost metagenome]